jgi:hypothetical protein
MNLINNLWIYIFFHLDGKSLRAIACVDHKFKKLSAEKALWKNAVIKQYDSKFIENLNYADNLVNNIWKKFIIADMKVLTPVKFTLVHKCPYFKCKDTYLIRHLSKGDNDTNLVLILREKDSDENSRNITQYCGYINENGLATTLGRIVSARYIYTGDLNCGQLSGVGSCYFKISKEEYKGGFLNSRFNGKGIYEYEYGFYYSECWSKSLPNKGILMYKDGGYFEGVFIDFERLSGIIIGDNGYKIYCQKFVDNQIDGLCIVEDASGYKERIEFRNGTIFESKENFYTKLNPSTIKCIQNKICTRAFTKLNYYPQVYYECLTCNITKGRNLGLCETCINICHKDHIINKRTFMSYAFYCDCHLKSLCQCFKFNENYSGLFNNIVPNKIVYHELLPTKYKINI